MKSSDNKTGYNAGHPWYYFLGGKPRRPKEIREATRQSGYKGYARDRIEAAHAMAEPKRSETLRSLRAKFECNQKRDISIYRVCVNTLRQTRWEMTDGETAASCGEIHTSLSIKHNHMVNDFAHLILLDELLS